MADTDFTTKNLKLLSINGYSSVSSDGTIDVNSPAFINLNADTVQLSKNLDINGQVAGDLIVSPGFAVGVGSTVPRATLDVLGDVQVGINTSQGVILTASNGTRWRLGVSTTGTLSTVQVT